MNDLEKRIANMTLEKRALLTLRLKQKRRSEAKKDFIPRRSNPLEYPLSYAQERIWFLDQLEPESAYYNVPAALHLTGHLDISALRHSLNEIVKRHEIFRSTFISEGGRPVQRIAPVVDLALSVIDLRSLPEKEKSNEVCRLGMEEAHRPFELSNGPLIRSSLIKMDEVNHVLLLTMHHIVFDGWSTDVFVRELTSFYEAASKGKAAAIPALPIQYADYAHWQRDAHREHRLKDQLDYWNKQLRGAPAILELPTDHSRPPIQTFKGLHHSFEFPKRLFEKLRELSRKEEVTLFMMGLAAFKVLLYRYTWQTDICVGTPVANRRQIEVEKLIGFFVNTLVLRTDLSGNPSFRKILHRVKDVALGAYANQELPFERLVDALMPQRDLSHSPLFSIMFDFQRSPIANLRLGRMKLNLMEYETGISKFDMMLIMQEVPGGIKGTFEYNTDLFNTSTIQRMSRHYMRVLEEIAQDPEQTIAELPLLGEDEKLTSLVTWNETGTDGFVDQCIHHLIEDQANRAPDAIALVFEGKRLTYSELDRGANRLANYLIHLGIGSECRVGLCLERTPEMVLAMLACLKSGGAYVPIDPNYPKERLSVMLSDAGLHLLLTLEKLHHLLPEQTVRIVCLDKVQSKIHLQSTTAPDSKVTAQNLAYVLFTSGSTGRPKGIAIEHRSAVSLLEWAKQVFLPEDISGVLASTSISWDLSVFEIFGTLSCGGTVILVENALQLPESSAANEVTLINTVPSAIKELVRSRSIPSSVRTINLAGEPLPTRLVNQLYELPHVRRVFDLYGPGEDTTYSTFTLRRPDGAETIGRPICNSKAYLLDACLNPVPVSVAGELYMSGSGLARGYFNRPDLTAENFLPDPFSDEPGLRLYKTGDLARWMPDGNIQFVGRIDHQVKIRGFRIELNEIREALVQHPNLRDVAILSREDVPGDKRLVAYVVPELPPGPSVSDLLDFLKQRLPNYMLPSSFIFMKMLPLTPNGKLDRRALPAPDPTRPDSITTYVAPRTPTEKILALIWTKVLGVRRVGIFDDFFELGGHSLLATQVISRVRDFFRLEISVREIFETSTVAELAERVERLQWATEGQPASIGDAYEEREEGEL